NSFNPNMTNNNRKCKCIEFNTIFNTNPETKLANFDKKMYKINGEKTPWAVEHVSDLEFPLITNKIDQKTLGKNISQDTCLNVVNDDNDFTHSNIPMSNHQSNMNDKVSQFLKWDTISKQNNEYYENLLNEYKLKSRLTSGLDEYNYESRDINDNIVWSNSNHVYWDEDVKYYRYPMESSLSTIDVHSDESKINDVPRIQSQPCLLDNYFKDTNTSSNKQRKMLDTFWKEISEFENSSKNSSDLYTKKNFKNYPDYKTFNSNKYANINVKQLNINEEKEYFKRNEEVSNQNQFRNDHNLNYLNLEPNLYIKNLKTSESHICDSSDYICKRQSKENSKKLTENKILDKGVNQIIHQADKHTQTQEMNNDFEKSINVNHTFCDECGNSHSKKNKFHTDTTENSLLLKRNKKLRELLGLKPEEKNVLVMLKL
ncbi:putative uncharacterized protein DDB_G0293878, partial [Rhopalosiphum maidis]|uniref:putative uncharacterized protein DDB_G0293878 n=1 Tax=Rhopalosiphum maidis TaxID=43146 RepID=UPI000EFE1206